MILIGISGKKLAGKNTVANIIESLTADCNKTTVVQLAFADALKDEVCKEFEISRSFLEENKAEYRKILQEWGELKRKIFGADYWVNKVLWKITRLPTEVGIVLVTDIRYVNEVEMFRKVGKNAYLFRIIRTQSVTADHHPSETELDGFTLWDSVITNDGSLQDLVLAIKQELIRLHICKSS